MPFHDAFEYMLRMVSAIKVGAEWCDIWKQFVYLWRH
jgi:hypothetical protein